MSGIERGAEQMRRPRTARRGEMPPRADGTSDDASATRGTADRRRHARRGSALVRRLALAKFCELRQAGMSYREIAARFGAADSAGAASIRDAAPPHPRAELPLSAAPRADGDTAVLLRALDAVGQGLAFFDCAGTLVYANAEVARVLDASPARDRLRTEIEHFARSLCALVQLRGLGGSTLAETMSILDVPAGEERYRLRGSFVGVDLFRRGGSVVVAVEAPAPTLLPAEVLRARFGLSRQESRIAHELARGRSNNEVAAALGISPHTARTHTQHVLEKLGVCARAQVATKILARGA